MEKDNIYLFRIITVQKAIDLFENKHLVLIKPSSWKDPFENLISKVTFYKKSKKINNDIIYKFSYLENVFGLCFTLGRESNLMWDAYTPYSNGVRIKINLEKLKNVIKKDKNFDFTKFTFKKVDYVMYNDLISTLNDAKTLIKLFKNQGPELLKYFFQKRREYKDEREFRIIYDANKTEYELRTTVEIKIEPSKLIENIRFDPKMNDKDCDALTKYFNRCGIDKRKIVRSLLYKYNPSRTIKLINDPVD